MHRFANASGGTSGDAVGGHAFSRDALSWTYDDNAGLVAYTTEGSWSNGTEFHLYRRERPKLVHGKDHRIVALFNGAWPCHVGVEDDDTKDGAAGCESFTMVAPIGEVYF